MNLSALPPASEFSSRFVRADAMIIALAATTADARAAASPRLQHAGWRSYVAFDRNTGACGCTTGCMPNDGNKGTLWTFSKLMAMPSTAGTWKEPTPRIDNTSRASGRLSIS